MGRAGVLQEIRRMRFEALLDRHERGGLSQIEEAEMLGVSERTFRRWRDRLRDEGPEGLLDRRIGKPSSRRAAEDEILRMLGLYRERYADFTIKHFHEQLVKRHAYKLGYTVTKLHLHRSGLVKPAPRRSAHRKKRPRRPLPGLLLHQDASRHAWLAGAPPLDLVVTLDDATSAIYSAFLVEEEGTASSFRGLWPRWWRRGGCSAPSTPIAAATISIRRRPAARCRGRSRRRSAGRLHSSASSTSPPTRRRRAAAPSAPSGRCRSGCRRSCGWPASPASRRPTAGWPRSICRSTTPASRCRPSRRAPPSSPTEPAAGARSSASRTNASSATTTPSSGNSSPCRSRRRRCVRTSSAPRSASTNTRTVGWPCSGGLTASPTTTRKA